MIFGNVLRLGVTFRNVLEWTIEFCSVLRYGVGFNDLLFRYCQTTFFRRNGIFPGKFVVYLSLATTRADISLRLRLIIKPVDTVLT